MREWQIVEEPDGDRIGIANAEIGCELYLPHWSTAHIDTAHSPPESGINAESLSYHAKDAWTYSLSHIAGAGAVVYASVSARSLDWLLPVTKLQLPFAFGEQLRQKWLEKG